MGMALSLPQELLFLTVWWSYIYLQYNTLQELNMLHFDDWASNFGETITAMELAPEGTGYRVKTQAERAEKVRSGSIDPSANATKD